MKMLEPILVFICFLIFWDMPHEFIKHSMDFADQYFVTHTKYDNENKPPKSRGEYIMEVTRELNQ